MPLDPESQRYFDQWLKDRAGAFYAAVYRRWGPNVEDAVQDCLVTICAGRARFTSMDHVEAWLWRCVSNGVITRIRQNKRNTPFGEEHDEAPGGRDPSTADDRDRLQIAVRACYLALNDYKRRILRSQCLEGRSVQEIADEERRPYGTVQSDLHRARRQLRECLEGRGVRWEDLVDVKSYLIVFDLDKNSPAEDLP